MAHPGRRRGRTRRRDVRAALACAALRARRPGRWRPASGSPSPRWRSCLERSSAGRWRTSGSRASTAAIGCAPWRGPWWRWSPRWPARQRRRRGRRCRGSPPSWPATALRPALAARAPARSASARAGGAGHAGCARARFRSALPGFSVRAARPAAPFRSWRSWFFAPSASRPRRNWFQSGPSRWGLAAPAAEVATVVMLGLSAVYIIFNESIANWQAVVVLRRPGAFGE